MTKNKTVLKTPRDVFKMLDLEHLNDAEFVSLRDGSLDKTTLCWAVRHLSECPECCRHAPRLSAAQIKRALEGTAYGRADFVRQTVRYYFQTLEGR